MIRFLYEMFTNRCYVHGDRLCDIVSGPFCKKCDAEADTRKRKTRGLNHLPRAAERKEPMEWPNRNSEWRFWHVLVVSSNGRNNGVLSFGALDARISRDGKTLEFVEDYEITRIKSKWGFVGLQELPEGED